MNVVAIDTGLNGAVAVSDERGDFIACFDLPTIGGANQCMKRIETARWPVTG